ncbi:MAG: hypothetical protein GXY83_19975 [Rhodopirellula sp.]|nr:hypothetical protein [Rhodopirellula sp.]
MQNIARESWLDRVSGTADDGLNQGNIHFELLATDNAGNQTTSEFTYYASDSSSTPPAKILEFRDSESAVVDVHDVVTSAVDVYGTAQMEGYSYELILYWADGKYYEVVDEMEDGHRVYKLQSDADTTTPGIFHPVRALSRWLTRPEQLWRNSAERQSSMRCDLADRIPSRL